MACQLDFFSLPHLSEIDMLKDEVKQVKDSSDKVRKSMYARHNELARKYTDLQERLLIIERNICCEGATMKLQS